MKKIDVHVHSSMWKNTPSAPGRYFITAEELRESYDALGIEKGILMPLIGTEAQYTSQSNEEAEYLAKNHPETYAWCCNVDPRMGKNTPATDFTTMLEYYKQHGVVGVGELTAKIPTDDPLLDNLFYHCAECDMPVTVHIAPGRGGTYGIIDECGLPRLEKMLNKYPKLKIVGHSQCFWSHISADVDESSWTGYPKGKVIEGRISELMRCYPNLYCDLSADSGFTAISRDPDFSARFIDEFGERIMFGTDIVRPGQTSKLSAWLDEAHAAGLMSDENYANICRENAIKIFNLSRE